MPMWCVAPLEMNEGELIGGKGTIGLQAAVPKMSHTRPLIFFPLDEQMFRAGKCQSVCILWLILQTANISDYMAFIIRW